LRHLLSGLLRLCAALVAISLPIYAQSAPPPKTNSVPPDLSGLWDPEGKAPWPKLLFTREEPPMLPWAAARYKEIRKDLKPLTAENPDEGRTDLDPAPYPYCMPYGFPRVYASTDLFEIVPTEGVIYILFESNNVQHIYTDGRKYPPGTPLTFMGQSIGRWEGDTLVVETKDMNGLTWIDGMGHPHTDALRVEQHFRRVDHDTLEINFLFDDPKTYSKPWGGKKIYKLRPSNEVVMNYFLCEYPMTQDFDAKVLHKTKDQ